MRYPHQNFLYYLILLGFCSKDILKLISKNKWNLPFKKKDYKETIDKLIKTYPGIYTSFSKKESIEKIILPDNMKKTGIDLFLNSEENNNKYIISEIEELLISKKRRVALEMALLTTHPFSAAQISKKMSYAFAASCSEEAILYYKKLFWDTSLTPTEWRHYFVVFDGKVNNFLSKIETKPVHRIESELGINDNINVEVILKEVSMKLYAKVKSLEEAPVKDEKLLTNYYNMLFKATDRLERTQKGNVATNVDEQLLLNFDRASKDRDDLLDISPFESFGDSDDLK